MDIMSDMARSFDVGAPRDKKITFRLTESELEDFDTARGFRSRSDYLRDRVREDLERKGIR